MNTKQLIHLLRTMPHDKAEAFVDALDARRGDIAVGIWLTLRGADDPEPKPAGNARNNARGNSSGSGSDA